MADSLLQELCVSIEHNFAATSVFKDTHDEIGRVAENMMRRAEHYTDAPVRTYNAVTVYISLDEHIGRRAVEASEAYYFSKKG